MKLNEFRVLFKKFRKEHKVACYGYDKIDKLHKEYEASLYTAPVPDSEETVNEFLRSEFKVWNTSSTNKSITINDFNKACQALQAANVPHVSTNYISTLPKAVPPWPTSPCENECPSVTFTKEEGKPMRYNDNYASATANVSTPKSDTATSRDYFLKRLEGAMYPKREGFMDLFNLNIDNQPKNYKDLIAAIKDGKYTIDKKVEKRFEASDEDNGWYFGSLHGIIWDGPKQDYEGYRKALEELKKQDTAARDAIMAAATAGDMKAAVDAFEAWTPTVATTTAQ